MVFIVHLAGAVPRTVRLCSDRIVISIARLSYVEVSHRWAAHLDRLRPEPVDDNLSSRLAAVFRYPLHLGGLKNPMAVIDVAASDTARFPPDSCGTSARRTWGMVVVPSIQPCHFRRLSCESMPASMSCL